MAGYKNKKGNAVIDGLTIVILMFILSVGTIFAYSFFSDFNTEIQAADDMSNTSKQLVSDNYTKFPSFMDDAVLMVFVLFIIYVLVSAFLLDTHPIFFIISVVLIIGVLIASMLLSNAYEEIMLDDSIVTFANSFPNIAFIMGNIVQIILGVTFLTAIVLYFKVR